MNTKSTTTLNIEKIRKDFPILHTKVHGKPLMYLDNANTTQKPQSVIDTLKKYYTTQNSNIHRGTHYLSEVATKEYESVREKVKNFLNAKSEKEIIFVRGTTEAINLVVNSYGRKNIFEGDEILISAMEHHSNIVPWQILCEEKKAKLKIIPINDNGELLLDEYEKLLTPKTKIVSLVYISNSLGTINPIKQMIELAHRNGIPVLIDGAQAAPHLKVDVQKLDCDFFAFSSHKIFGPTGTGVLYGKSHLLESMPPYQGGGDMIKSVTFEKTIYNDIPYKFEAGTPNIADVIGMGAAIDYLQSVGFEAIQEHEKQLLEHATELIQSVEGVRLIGTAKKKASVLSFVMKEAHPHDIGTILDREGIAVRTGHHCTQPVMQRFKIPATVRASFAFYNTHDEVEKFISALGKVKEIFS